MARTRQPKTKAKSKPAPKAEGGDAKSVRSEAAKKGKLTKNTPLNKYQCGVLLEDIENAGVPRANVTLGMITSLSAQKDAFYAPDDRVQYRRKLQTYQKQKLDKYLTTLAFHSVEPGPQTLQELDQQDAEEAGVIDEDEDDEEFTLGTDNDDDDDDDDDDKTTQSGTKDDDKKKSSATVETKNNSTIETRDSTAETKDSTGKTKDQITAETKAVVMDANKEDEYADFDLSESGGFNKTGTPTATFAHEKPPSKTGPTGQTVSFGTKNLQSMPAPKPPPSLPPRIPAFKTVAVGRSSHFRTDTTFASPLRIMNTPPRRYGATDTNVVGNNESAYFEGARSNPIKVVCNVDHVERTLHGFKCIFVPTMKRYGDTRPAFRIQKEYNVPDAEKVKAMMPQPGEFPEYKGHCFLVSEPSLSTLQTFAFFQHTSKEAQCPDSLDVNQGIQTFFLDDQSPEDRKVRWYLLILPEEVNNIHFSRSSDLAVPTLINETIIPDDFVGNDTGTEIIACMCIWDIACAHGGHRNTGLDSNRKKTRKERLDEMRKAMGDMTI